MPRIREYMSEAAARGLNVSPLENLASAQAAAGRAKADSIRTQWDAAANAAKDIGGKIEQYREQDDMSKLAKNTAMTHAELNVQWDETLKKANPDDPDTAQKFMDEVVNPRLDKLGEGIESRAGQEAYQRTRDGIMGDLFQKTHIDTSNLRGTNAVNSILTFRNTMSQSLSQDPSGFDHAIGLGDTMLHGLTKSWGLSTEESIKFRRDMFSDFAKAAVRGSAQQNPDQALKELDGGKYAEYLDEGENATLHSYIHSQVAAQTEAMKAARVEQDRAKKEAAGADAASISASVLQEDGTMAIPPDYYKNIIQYAQTHADVTGTDDTVRSLTNFGRAITDDIAKGIERKTDPATFEDFKGRVVGATGDVHTLVLNDVYNAYAAGKLSQKDFMFFKGWVMEAGKNPEKVQNQKVLNKFLQGYKALITKSNMMSVDAVGNQQFFNFSQEMQARYDAGVASGKKPYELTDINSPDFIAKDLAKFQLTKEQARQALHEQIRGAVQPIANGVKPAVAPRAKGESAADFLKRNGNK